MIARLTGNYEYLRWCSPTFADFPGLANSKGDALELGAGTGQLLERLKGFGWRVLGLDISESAAAIAAMHGIAVQVTALEDATLPESRFDLAIMHHSLEHLSDPNVGVKLVHRSLREGGLFLLVVPNAESPGLRFFGPAWPSLDVPRHLFHFTPDQLKALLQRSGFEVNRILFENNVGEIILALRNLIRYREAVRRKLAWPHLRGRRTAVGDYVLLASSILVSIAYAVILRWSHLGLRNSILLIARKANLRSESN